MSFFINHKNKIICLYLLVLKIACVQFGNNIVSVPGVENALSNCLYLYSEVVNYTDHIFTDSLGWVEAPYYTRTITLKETDMLEITYRIPFSGNSKGDSRSRIRVMFDDTEVLSFMKYNSNSWELQDMFLSGKVFNILPGQHTIKLMVVVDSGTFYFPHYNKALIEAKLPPTITANLYFIGYTNINNCSLNSKTNKSSDQDSSRQDKKKSPFSFKSD
jgi:hypothetical protein